MSNQPNPGNVAPMQPMPAPGREEDKPLTPGQIKDLLAEKPSDLPAKWRRADLLQEELDGVASTIVKVDAQIQMLKDRRVAMRELAIALDRWVLELRKDQPS